MIIIILILIVFAVLWFSKSFWSAKLISFFKRRSNGNIERQNIEKVGVFSPQGVSRTFVVAIDIVELGDGTADISIAKVKQKAV